MNNIEGLRNFSRIARKYFSDDKEDDFLKIALDEDRRKTLYDYIERLEKEAKRETVPRQSFAGRLETYHLLDDQKIDRLAELRRKAIETLLKTTDEPRMAQFMQKALGLMGGAGLAGSIGYMAGTAAAGALAMPPVVILGAAIILFGWMMGTHSPITMPHQVKELLGDLRNIDHIEKAIIRNAPERFQSSLRDVSLHGLITKVRIEEDKNNHIVGKYDLDPVEKYGRDKSED